MEYYVTGPYTVMMPAIQNDLNRLTRQGWEFAFSFGIQGGTAFVFKRPL